MSDDLEWLSISGEEGGEGNEGAEFLYEYRRSNEAKIRTLVGDAGLGHKFDKGLRQVHRFQPDQRDLGANRSFRTLVDRHQRGSTHKFLFYNTWLLNVPIDSQDKPLLDQRSREIGRALDRDGYDIVGLCEVYDDAEKDAICDEISRPFDVEVGPDQAFQESSGLVTIAAGGRSVTHRLAHEYIDQGDFFESDYHATKGVLYTEIQLDSDDDSMRLDLYTTHTNAANKRSRLNQITELATFVAETTQPQNVTIITGDLNVDFRRSEYGEALETLSQIDVPVVDRRGYPENLHRYVDEHRVEIAEQLLEDAGVEASDAIDELLEGDLEGALDSVGDAIESFFGAAEAADVELPFDPFDADATTIADHFDWQVETHEIEFDDLWLVRGGRAGATHEVQNYDAVCALDDEHSPDGHAYCRDYDVPEIKSSPPSDTIPGYRLDYVFLQAPANPHTFNLDATRIRRRPFWRSEDPDVEYLDPTAFSHTIDLPDDVPDIFPEVVIPHFMSDHIGLEVTFIASHDDSEYRTRRFE
ncbi:MAG: hypothetical protein ACQETI_02665 [Halobacteriota archaeon]